MREPNESNTKKFPQPRARVTHPMAKPDTIAIHPAILCGGVGTRLWPMSRVLFPKQLQPLASDLSLLQETVIRVREGARFAAPLVVCNEKHRFMVEAQLRAIDSRRCTVVVEPEGRNTAPAAAVAAVIIGDESPDALLLVLPSDHVIGDVAGFHAAVDRAMAGARSGALVTFGIEPGGPETGYGYIKQGAVLNGAAGCYRIDRFLEKPELDVSNRCLAEGGWLWNGGMFLFTAGRYLAELERFRPEMVAACREAVARGRTDGEFVFLDERAFAATASESIDYAVMEHTSDAAVVPMDVGWSDVGAWPALWELAARDEHGNVLVGDVRASGVRNAYLRSEGPLLAVVGLEDVIMVATHDAVLAVSSDRAQEVKALAESLKAEGRSESIVHSVVYRPWGHYQTVDAGDRFQVKRITVDPGAKLSLQKHRHRAEHWVVVSGTAKATCGERTVLLHANESIFIPLGAVHRLENPGDEPLEVIEVQSGDYLGEDDIVRLEDAYGRIAEPVTDSAPPLAASAAE